MRIRISSFGRAFAAVLLCCAALSECSDPPTSASPPLGFDPNDNRPVLQLALGDSLIDTLDNGRARHRFAIRLAQGDTIDILIRLLDNSGWPVGLAAPELHLSQTSASRLGLFAAQVIPASGTYGFVVTPADTSCLSSCIPAPATVAYHVVARRAAPVVILEAYDYMPLVRGGAVHDDTVWLHNIGAGRLSATVGTTANSWLIPLTPSAQASASPVPGDTSVSGGHDVALLFRVDARALPEGRYAGTLLINAPGAWERYVGSPIESFPAGVVATVYDSTITYLPTTPDVYLVPSLDGQLYSSRGDTVFRVDPTSGALSFPRLVAGGPELRQVGRDGAVYVPNGIPFGSGTSGVRRVSLDGTQTLLHATSSTPNAVIPSPDSSIYVLEGTNQLYHYGNDGTHTLVATLPVALLPNGLVVNPIDHGIYYTASGAVHRVDIASGVDSVRGQLPSDCTPLQYVCRLLAVDAAGRMYGATPIGFAGGALLVSADGRIVQRIITGGWVLGLTVRGDTLYGSGVRGSAKDPGTLWRKLIK